jgi:hypothetical protein
MWPAPAMTAWGIRATIEAVILHQALAFRSIETITAGQPGKSDGSEES